LWGDYQVTINAARYGLITHEYRFGEAYNATIDARYTRARELELPTELDLGKITTLLTDMFAVIGSVRRRFLVELKGCDSFKLDDFSGSVPARILQAPELGANSLSVIVTRAEINEGEDITTVEVWG
jgi:hypothetical protein